MNFLKNCTVLLLAFQLGIGPILAQPILNQQNPFQNAVGSGISNLRVTNLSADGTEALLTMDYTYDGFAGPIAIVIPSIEKKGQKGVSVWFGSDPATIGQGRGSISIKVKYFNDEPGVPPMFTSDQVNILILNRQASAILTKIPFLKTVKWGSPDAKPVTAAAAPVILNSAANTQIAEEKARTEIKNREQARLKAEGEAVARRDAEAKALAEVKAREQARAKAEAEATRLAQEERNAQQKRLAEEKAREEVRLKAEIETKRLAEERRLADEREAMEARAREDAQSKAAAEEKARRIAEEKAIREARLREEARLKAETEAARLASEKLIAEQKAIAEAQAREQARLKAVAEAKRLAEEKQIAEEKAKNEAEEQERIRLTAEIKARETARLKAEAEAKRLAEERRVAEARAAAEAKAREEARLKAEAEAKRIAEERRIAEVKAITEARAREEARLRAEAETKARAAAEVKARADAQAREEARLKAEAEAKRLAEEKRIADQQRVAEATAREQARIKAETEAKRLAEETRIAEEKAKFEAEARILAEQLAKQEADAKAKAEAEATRLAAEKSQTRKLADSTTASAGNVAIPSLEIATGLKSKVTNVEIVQRSIDRSQMTIGVEYDYKNDFGPQAMLGVNVLRLAEPQVAGFFQSPPMEIGKSRRNFMLFPVKFQPPASAANEGFSTDKVLVYLLEAANGRRFNLFPAAVLLMWHAPGMAAPAVAQANGNSVEFDSFQQNDPSSGYVTIKYNCTEPRGKLCVRVFDAANPKSADWFNTQVLEVKQGRGVQVLDIKVESESTSPTDIFKATTIEIELRDAKGKSTAKLAKQTTMTWAKPK